MADSIGDIFSNARQKLQTIKNTVLNVPEIVQKVDEATSNDPWGASSTLMYEIADATHSYQDFTLITSSLWSKINDPKRKWTTLYKSLTLAEFIAINGHERCFEDLKEHTYELRQLTKYEFVDENMVDRGLNVREKAKKISDLITDPKKLADERAKSEKNRGKYSGVSSDGSRGFGSSSASASSGGYSGFSSRSAYSSADYESSRATSYSSESYNAPTSYSSSSSSYTAPKVESRATSSSRSAAPPTDVSGDEAEDEPKPTRTAAAKPAAKTSAAAAKPKPAQPKAPSSLIDFGDATPASTSAAAKPASSQNLLDDLLFVSNQPQPPAGFQGGSAATSNSAQSSNWASFGDFQSFPAAAPAPQASFTTPSAAGNGFDFNPRGAAPSGNSLINSNNGFGDDWGAFSQAPAAGFSTQPATQAFDPFGSQSQARPQFQPQSQSQPQQFASFGGGQPQGFYPAQQQFQQPPQAFPSSQPSNASGFGFISQPSNPQGFQATQPDPFQSDFGAFQSSQPAGSTSDSKGKGDGLSSLLTTHSKLLNFTDLDSKKQQAATLPPNYKSNVPLSAMGQKPGGPMGSSSTNVPMNAMRPAQTQQQPQSSFGAFPQNTFGNNPY